MGGKGSGCLSAHVRSVFASHGPRKGVQFRSAEWLPVAVGAPVARMDGTRRYLRVVRMQTAPGEAGSPGGTRVLNPDPAARIRCRPAAAPPSLRAQPHRRCRSGRCARAVTGSAWPAGSMTEVWIALLLYGGWVIDDLSLPGRHGVRRIFGRVRISDPTTFGRWLRPASGRMVPLLAELLRRMVRQRWAPLPGGAPRSRP